MSNCPLSITTWTCVCNQHLKLNKSLSLKFTTFAPYPHLAPSPISLHLINDTNPSTRFLEQKKLCKNHP